MKGIIVFYIPVDKILHLDKQPVTLCIQAVAIEL
jgi:hypothetical protein